MGGRIKSFGKIRKCDKTHSANHPQTFGANKAFVYAACIRNRIGCRISRMSINNLEILLAAVGIGLAAYAVSQHPKCDQICQQVFGSAASEAGKIFASTAIAMIAAQSVQPKRTYSRA